MSCLVTIVEPIWCSISVKWSTGAITKFGMHYAMLTKTDVVRETVGNFSSLKRMLT